MTLPVNVSTATVTGTFVTVDDGSPAVGTVTFQPVPCRLHDASADVVLLGVPVVATLDAEGSFSVELVATDDPDLNPVDWAYAVTVRLSDPVQGWRFAMYAPAGATVDVSDAMPIDDPATGYGYISGAPGPPGEGVPVGGTSGQVLAKVSAADFDTAWTAASAPGVHATTHVTGGTDPIATFAATTTGLVPASGGGTTQYLRADGTWATPAGGGAGVTDGDKGDIVVSGSGATWTFDSTVVSSTARTLLDDTTVGQMRTTLSVPAVTTTITPTAPLTGGGDLSSNRTLAITQFAGSAPGSVPTSAGGSTNFLRADGSWAAPPGSGGTTGHATFVFNATTTAPPAATQIRMNNASQTAATTLWVSQNDFDNLDVTLGLEKILAGHQIYIQDYDDASKWVKYNVTAAVDSGAYFTFTIAYHSGPAGLPTGSGAAGKIELQGIAPGSVGVPPGGAASLVLAKTAAADYAVDWVTGRWQQLTAAAYAALTPKDANVLYVVIG